jgi:ribosome-binding protein aMBF1 (putative translation factor)
MSRRSKYGTEFGASVSRALAESRMTQTELAEGLGKSVSYTNQVITGRKKPTPKWADLVADVMGLSNRKRVELHRAAAKDAGFQLDLTLPKKP